MIPNQARSLLAVAVLFCLACFAAAAAATESAGYVAAAHGGGTSAGVETPQSGASRHFRRSLGRVQPLLMRYGSWAAAAATLVEGVGIPMPGQTLLIAAGLEAAAGRLNLALLLFLVTAAAIFGNSIGYGIGRWGGRYVLNKLKVNPKRQQYLEDLFKRYGGLIVLLGRFVDGLRQLNGIVSGIMKMPWWRFTAYNVAGALLWTGAWGLGTYYLGRRIHFIAAFFHHHRALLFILSVTALLGVLVYSFRSSLRQRF